MKRLDELGVSPAPWRMERFSPWSTEDGRDIKDALSRPVGCTYTISDHAIADARLIAAAPNMYEALAAMLSCAEKNAPYLDMSHMDIAMDMARKAIRKAGGEE